MLSCQSDGPAEGMGGCTGVGGITSGWGGGGVGKAPSKFSSRISMHFSQPAGPIKSCLRYRKHLEVSAAPKRKYSEWHTKMGRGHDHQIPHIKTKHYSQWHRTQRGGRVGTRPWWLALLACGGACWFLTLESSAMTSRASVLLQASALPQGGRGGRWVPQHTYLKMIPMTH